MSDEFIEGRSLRNNPPPELRPLGADEPRDPMTDDLPFVIHDTADDLPPVPGPPTLPMPFPPAAPTDPRPEPKGESMMRLPRVVLDADEEDDSPGQREKVDLRRTDKFGRVVIKRPEDTMAGEPVDAELVTRTEEKIPPVRQSRIFRRVRDAAGAPDEPENPRRWGVPQLALMGGFLIVTLAIIFVPGLIALLGPTDPDPIPGGVPPRPTDPPAPTATPRAAVEPPAVPGLSGQIAFSSDRSGDFDLYLLDLATGETLRLTDTPANDRSPTWSPDGEQIVFSSDEAGGDDLYVINADGSGRTRITMGQAADQTPAWSPDGSRIVFVRATAETSALLSFPAECMATATCEDSLRVFADDRFYLDPSWSPDSEQVAATAFDFPGLPSVIALLGGGVQATLEGTGTSDFAPAWSPDGERIAFVSLDAGGFEIWVEDSGGLARITDNDANDVDHACTPKIQLMAFATDSGGDFEIAVCTPSGCVPNLLTDNSADDLNPAWRP
ncbi:MAG: TolB family protein [Anaerolineae bacterium]